MTIIDGVLLPLLFVVQPIYGAWSYRRFLNMPLPLNRMAVYRETLIMQ